MYIIVIAWTYIALMMAVVEATASNGTVLGALITFVLYGALPLSIVIYLFGRPARRRLRERAQAASAALVTPSTAPGVSNDSGSIAQPDAGSHAAADAVSPVRKEA